VPRAPREQDSWPRVFARSSLRPWGLEPTVRRRVRPIEPFTPPTSSDPARRRFREAPTRRSPAPSEAAWEAAAPSAHLVDETCCPRPLPAAPRASLVLHPRAAARGHVGGPRRRSISVCQSAGLSRGRPSLLRFCPLSSTLASKSCSDARLMHPSDLATLRALHLGVGAPSPEHPRSSWRHPTPDGFHRLVCFALPSGRLSPSGKSLESFSSRWPNSEPLRARPPSPLRVTARCGSCRLPLQRLTASSQRTSTVTRARPGSRGVRFPFRGLCCRPGSAFLASSAPPSPFETASGSSLFDLTPGTKAPEDPLLEFASPSEPNCVSAARASVSR